MSLMIDKLNMAYTSGNQTINAVSDISLNIKNHDFICILGPSGCGKSTILRCIAAYEKPSGGHIYVDGADIKKPGPDRAMVFQSFDQLFPWLTVYDNIMFPLKVNKMHTVKSRASIVNSLIKLVNLKGFENLYPHQLSGGMKQRVAIARSIALNPKILLMDEPFGSLDFFTRQNLQGELLRIWQRSDITVVFVTHNIDEAIYLSTKIVILTGHPGRIVDIIENDMTRPRKLDDRDYIILSDKLKSIFGINTYDEDNLTCAVK